jgi:hypothetical protein
MLSVYAIPLVMTFWGAQTLEQLHSWTRGNTLWWLALTVHVLCGLVGALLLGALITREFLPKGAGDAPAA